MLSGRFVLFLTVARVQVSSACDSYIIPKEATPINAKVLDCSAGRLSRGILSGHNISEVIVPVAKEDAP